jgi:hypothetical protein
MIYLMLAALWLGLALTAFLVPYFKPWTIPNTDISVGWLALAFLLYNLARWWTTRRKQPPDRRLLHPSTRHFPRDEPPDPQFQFRDESK